MYLNQISMKYQKGEIKQKSKKMALENIKLLYESWEAVMKLFNNYSWIISQTKYKTINGKGIPSMLARLTRVAKFSDRKVSDQWNLKILTPKQMLQRLLIALAQVKAANIFENS